MKIGHAIICRFDTVSDLRGKDRTYENIKAAVLKAGKFSVFDVETNRDGRLFTELCRDPEIETFDLGYPWTGVRRRTKCATDRAKVCPECDSEILPTDYCMMGHWCGEPPRRSRKPLGCLRKDK